MEMLWWMFYLLLILFIIQIISIINFDYNSQYGMNNMYFGQKIGVKP